MKFEKNEVRTGILLLITLGVLVAVLLLLGAPGLFKPLKTYEVFFDNAAGVKAGAPVLLAGRKVGQVISISTPVPRTLRPTRHPDYEALIQVRISDTAKVYRDATARMSQLGLLGEQVIDFIEGNETTGLAEPGYTFIGTRSPDFSESIPRIIHVLEPVASNATLTLDDLRKTIASLNVFFAREGELAAALTQIKLVGANLATETAKDGPLTMTLQNVQKLTAGLSDQTGPLQISLANLRKTTDQLNNDDNIKKVIANFEAASLQADRAARQASLLLAGITPQMTQAASNFEEMTDTLKRQPWRLVYPGTKKYEEPSTTVTKVPRGQGGPATVVTRSRSGKPAPAVIEEESSNPRRRHTNLIE